MVQSHQKVAWAALLLAGALTACSASDAPSGAPGAGGESTEAGQAGTPSDSAGGGAEHQGGESPAHG